MTRGKAREECATLINNQKQGEQEMQKPYVGVTGFMTREEVDAVLSVVPNSPNPSRLLMVGVLVSSKTLMGIPNKWPKRYPSPDRVRSIFPRDARALNLIHYNTKDASVPLDEQLERLTQLTTNLDGFQLNICWPSPETLQEFFTACGQNWRIVLQVGSEAFERIDNDPAKLTAKLQEYEGLVDYALLDPSGGLGKPLDHAVLRPYLEALTAKNLDIGLGVAGGLSPTTLDLVQPLVLDFPNLSIDAEGKLRTSVDDLDVPVTQEYVRRSLALFNR